MKLTPEEFNKLQQEWYKRLEEQGFKDIENENVKRKKEISTYPLNDDDDNITINFKEEYFTLISHAIQNEKTVFGNEVHRYILTRHSQGAQIKEIAKETSKHRHSIRFIIRRYEMAWGIKFYTRKQLNLKEKHG